jgi:hypothetical protein
MLFRSSNEKARRAFPLVGREWLMRPGGYLPTRSRCSAFTRSTFDDLASANHVAFVSGDHTLTITGLRSKSVLRGL